MRSERRDTDIVVVGSGPGGATVARQCARAGKKVILLEKGRDNSIIGNHLSALTYVDKSGFFFSEEGLNIVRGIITGGSTILYCGTASPPPPWLKDTYRIDLSRFIDETIAELKIQPLPRHLLGESSIRCMDAANSMGLSWAPLPKFMDPSRCEFSCGATCMLGCSCGAKWTAREYIRDAKIAGAELITRTDVQEVIIEGGQATGVRAAVPGGMLEIRAKAVVLSAGGLGTPVILQKSGTGHEFPEAGVGMFMDPTVMVYGVIPGRGTSADPPMSVGSYDDSEGFILSHLIDPWFLFPLIMSLKGIRHALRVLHYRRIMGIMIKVKDELAGTITMEGDVSKPLTQRDRSRLNRGAILARKILLRAGADPSSIVITPVRGTHPGGTCRIGSVVDTDLRTQVKGLYVSDASVIPEALDRPMVLTIIALSKRLSDTLISAVQ